MAKNKTYVVWNGRHPGIYETWDDCRAEVENFPDARYKGFSSRTDAIMAWRKSADDAEKLLMSIAEHLKEEREAYPPELPPERPPEVILDSLAVDGACKGNPGVMEYRGVYVRTGQEVFRVGPYEDGTNNIGEFLAIVHGLALLKRKGSAMPVYSDSLTARKWVRDKRCNSKLTPTPRNAELFKIVRRAEAWLLNNTYPNPVLKWETEKWGEIPADFGRK